MVRGHAYGTVRSVPGRPRGRPDFFRCGVRAGLFKEVLVRRSSIAILTLLVAGLLAVPAVQRLSSQSVPVAQAPPAIPFEVVPNFSRSRRT